MKILVIVESPAKCKKIESYLGPGYKCVASFGHLRALNSMNNIDIKNNFKPTFEIMDDKDKKSNKKHHVEFLRKEILESEEVILATDDDREGEAIAWHICDMFGLPVETTKRIIFHEITENAIQTAMLYPKIIDMKKVNSQQARQILDLIVGFNISPMLWKYISKASKNGLSAGRCQTPALKLIYDNQKEIDNVEIQKVYNTTGYFTNKCISFELNTQMTNDVVVSDFLEKSVDFKHVYTRSDVVKVFKQPPEPLTTSRLQQLISNEMHISPKETMKSCQILYEAGYITYMRTDSKKYSDEFIETVKNYISREYNQPFQPFQLLGKVEPNLQPLGNQPLGKVEPNKPKKKVDLVEYLAQPFLKVEAHEAIRPTNILIKTIQNETEKLSSREKKIYKLIWETTMESCMQPAEYFSFIGNISTCMPGVKYVIVNEIVYFLGWKIVKNKEKDLQNSEKNYNYLLQIKQGGIIEYKKISSKITLKNTKLHYTESRLVQLLEDHGIGRPSTFASLIDKIQDREYVKKENVVGKQIMCKDFELEDDILTKSNVTREFGNEKNKLIIQPLGIIVLEFLEKNFTNIFNYDYTKYMENELDKISKGETIWYELCEKCFNEITENCENLINEKKHEIKIDELHYYIIGKYGPVIKCIDLDDVKKISFKNVKKDIDLKKLERGEYKLEDIIEQDNHNQKEMGMYKNEPLILRKGKYGLYVTWGNNSKSLSSVFGNRPIENILLEEIVEILEKNSEASRNDEPNNTGIVRIITNEISIRKGKYGDYIFYKTSKMSKPTFLKLGGFKEDYKTCNIKTFLEWFSSSTFGKG